jgi:lysine 6-dehydrogenase
MNMRIVVFGGAGDVGSRTVEDLAASEGVERVTIADRNAAAARRLAARLGGCGASVEVAEVDARDHDTLVRAMKGHDAAASALGPFYLFERKLVAAAVDAGVNYASVCDDYSAAEEVMDRFQEPARRRGCTIVIGLGVSPGITNAGIRYFADRMDRLKRADIYVYQPLNAGGGEAVLRHMLFIMTGKVAAWRNGRSQRIKACSEERVVEFPRFGPIRVWNMGHAEPVTVPRFMPDIEEVNFFMGYGRGARLFVEPARRGLFGRRLAVEGAVRLVSAVERILPSGPPAPGAVRIDLWGEKGGEAVHRMACGIGGMREATGLSLSVGTLLLCQGKLTSRKGGVYSPEGCLKPVPFIKAMKKKGIEAYSDLAMTRPLP